MVFLRKDWINLYFLINFIMEIKETTINQMKKSHFDVTDTDNHEVDLTKLAEQPQDAKLELRAKGQIVQDNLTPKQIVVAVNDLFAA